MIDNLKERNNKISNQVGLPILESVIIAILFLLQGTSELRYVILLAFIVLIVSKRMFAITFPLYFGTALLVYLPYLILGIYNKHPNFQIDIKFQLYFVLFYFYLIQRDKNDLLETLIGINYVVLAIFLLLKLQLFPNFWSEQTFGYEGRIYGPSINVGNFILFYYILHGKSIDKKLLISFLVSICYILLSSNFMNLLILFGLLGLLSLDKRTLLKGGALMVVLLIILLNFPSLFPALVAKKLSFVGNPMEYGSVAIRITDLLQAINNTKYDIVKIFVGEGFGATTTIFRVNEIAPSLSRYITFLEIDNGFYYLFHRGGVSLLLLFLLGHFFLLRLIPSIKGRLAFLLVIVMTNLFSIHYYTLWFNVLYTFMIIQKYGNQQKLFSMSIKMIQSK